MSGETGGVSHGRRLSVAEWPPVCGWIFVSGVRAELRPWSGHGLETVRIWLGWAGYWLPGVDRLRSRSASRLPWETAVPGSSQGGTCLSALFEDQLAGGSCWGFQGRSRTRGGWRHCQSTGCRPGCSVGVGPVECGCLWVFGAAAPLPAGGGAGGCGWRLALLPLQRMRAAARSSRKVAVTLAVVGNESAVGVRSQYAEYA